jgi:hypothetical protein
VLLKRRQDGFGSEGDLYVHGLMHSVRVLTDGSGETASTPKIVSDVARTSTCRCERYDEPAHAASWARRRCCDVTGGSFYGSTDKR